MVALQVSLISRSPYVSTPHGFTLSYIFMLCQSYPLDTTAKWVLMFPDATSPYHLRYIKSQRSAVRGSFGVHSAYSELEFMPAIPWLSVIHLTTRYAFIPPQQSNDLGEHFTRLCLASLRLGISYHHAHPLAYLILPIFSRNLK